VTRGYLVDTSVLSTLASGREGPVTEWLRRESDRLYVSAITVAEIEQGVHKLRRTGAAERAGRLSQWLDGILSAYGDRVLALDTAAARAAGSLSDEATSLGRHPGLADVAIAATASVHGLTVLTRNARHFEALGAPFADPFVRLPEASMS
jgi:hypothetical protein